MAEEPQQLSPPDPGPTGLEARAGGPDFSFDLLGIGMSILDDLQVVEEFPSTTGVTEVKEAALMGGGPVPTALCAAARLGATAAIIDRVGDDWKGEHIRKDFERFGVGTRFLEVERGRTSSFGTILVRRRDGERHILFQEGSSTQMETRELPVDALRRCHILHLNGRHWPACVEAARIVREAGGRISFDGGAHRYQRKFEELLPLVDILVVARDFAGQLSGSEDHEDQLAALMESGALVAGITDGERGSRFLTGDGEQFHQPAFPADPLVDTTGCGDVFHGAFLAEAARGENWRSCARFASAAAALSATRLGGRGRLAQRTEVERFAGRAG